MFSFFINSRSVRAFVRPVRVNELHQHADRVQISMDSLFVCEGEEHEDQCDTLFFWFHSNSSSVLNLSLCGCVCVCVCVCACPCTYASSHHVGLPGLLYIMCGDDDRHFPRPHNLHQMLPDPRKKNQRRNQTDYVTPDPLVSRFSLKS